MNNNILIGLSWPYANGELHIGHLGSSLPADVMARYFRLCGDKVMFVSGSDCFGTPTSIQAQKENTLPMDIVDKYHKKFVEAFKQADFLFENYSRTTDPAHIQFAQDFHRKVYKTEFVKNKSIMQYHCETCGRFLADRYVVGLCPFCNAHAKGDSCDKCGKMLEPEILLQPKCSICGSTPIMQQTSQIYLQLSKHEDALKSYFNAQKNLWTLNAVNMTNRYFEEGLQDRAITRNLNWGVPVPDCSDKDKVIYNWAENVLGYVSATKTYCENNGLNYNDWWNNKNAKHYYVHAKDNIPFHSLIFPALLLSSGENYHLPDAIIAFEYVTIEGKKISKSAGTALSAKELLDIIPVDLVRYYFLKNISDRKDLNFSFLDFVNTVNGELINNWGNLVNRTLSFIKNKFNGQLPNLDVHIDIKNKIEATFTEVASYIESGKIAAAIKSIMELVSIANKTFDTYAPWASIKVNEAQCKQQLVDVATIIANVAILLKPFLPTGSQNALAQLNIKSDLYQPYYFTSDICLADVFVLYQRLDYKVIQQQFSKYMGGK